MKLSSRQQTVSANVNFYDKQKTDAFIVRISDSSRTYFDNHFSVHIFLII